MVTPYNESLLNPASLDLLLGDQIMVEVEHTSELQIQSIAHCTKEAPYWLAPSEFVLAQTKETFSIPDNICAQFVLKSSRAREGYENLLAGFADPGWTGSSLTLELHNSRRYHNLPLYPGLKIGQFVFMQMASIPNRTYQVTGRYNNDQGVRASKG
jgi:dCTP deaminase